jgi:hypothetical protein
LFASISDRTGWTPRQISELTLKQIKLYIKAWNGDSGKKRTMINPDLGEIKAFNLSSGIERIPKKK